MDNIDFDLLKKKSEDGKEKKSEESKEFLSLDQRGEWFDKLFVCDWKQALNL